MMDFRDKTVATGPGELLLVPKGVEHRPWTRDGEVRIILIEPKGTKHTGNLVTDQTVEVSQQDWI
jgi:mannose-6-phosphate isomerase-like protein (cupin superfamily)